MTLSLLFVITAVCISLVTGDVCEHYGNDFKSEAYCLRRALWRCNGQERDEQNNDAPAVHNSLNSFPAHSPPSEHFRAEMLIQQHPRQIQSNQATSVLSNDHSSRTPAGIYNDDPSSVNTVEGKIREAENRVVKLVEMTQRKHEMDVRELQQTLELLLTPVHTWRGYEYIFVNRVVSWYDAEAACAKLNGHLVSINGPAENEYVKALHGQLLVWTGMNDIEGETRFVWTDGTDAKYFNWAVDQPDNLDHNQNCVEQDEKGLWYDALCYVTRKFVCKRKM